MKIISSFCMVALCFTMLSVTACKRKVVEGRGTTTTENRTASGFTAIDIETSIDAKINVSAGSTASVEMKGYKNLIEHIKTEVNGNTLRVYSDKLFHFSSDKDLEIHITLPVLTDLSATGAGDVDVTGNITGDKFELHMTGAGNAVIESMNVASFVSDISGAGNVTIKSGVVNNAEYDVTGMGNISAFGLQSRTTTASVTGAGDIDVNVTEKLDASVTGAGTVTYKGKPIIKASTTGAGSVEEAN